MSLASLYHALHGAGWSNNGEWLSNSPICDWYGVVCTDDGSIHALELAGNRVTGTLPSQLGLLPALQTLHVYNANVSGTLPTQLGNLGELRKIAVAIFDAMDPMPLSGTVCDGVNSSP